MNEQPRALQAILETLQGRSYRISEELAREIYGLEERVQFLDDRGSTARDVARLIEATLTQEDDES